LLIGDILIELQEVRGESINTMPRKSVLIIDDNVDMLMLHELILEMAGYTVFTSSSGKQALTVLDEIAEPGLILLDMRMDDMSGPEFLKILELQKPEIFENVPVVYLTAMDDVPEGKHKGFLRKPIDHSKLIEAVHGFIDVESVPNPIQH
jgi:CheY-like chemotaxis protein